LHVIDLAKEKKNHNLNASVCIYWHFGGRVYLRQSRTTSTPCFIIAYMLNILFFYNFSCVRY